MENIDTQQRYIVHAENVTVGDSSSRLSSAIMVLLWIVPLFSMILFGAVDKTTWIVLSIVWAAIVLLWLAESWKGKGLLINPSILQLPLIGLLMIASIQLLPLGGDISGGLLSVPAARSLSLEPYSTRFFIVRLVVFTVFFSACLAFINNERRLKKTVLIIVIFGGFMAFFGILQRLANPDGIYGLRGTPRSIPFGPFVNQHHFAAFMEMTVGVTMGLLVGKRTAKDKKILLAIALAVMVAATILTSSRGGVLGVFSVTAFVVLISFFSGRWSKDKSGSSASSAAGVRQKIAVAAAGAALLIIIFGLVIFLGGGESLLRGIGGSDIQNGISNGRSHFWPIAFQIFLDHPILGAGFDAFGFAFAKHDTWNGYFFVDQAHNEYLQMLAEAGIAGFSYMIVFIYFLFRKGFATISRSHGFRRDAAIGALAGCFGILIHSFFDFPLRTFSNSFFFLLLCAVATVPIASQVPKSSRRRTVTEH